MKSLLGSQEGHLKDIGLHPLKQLKLKTIIRAAKALGTKKPQRDYNVFDLRTANQKHKSPCAGEGFIYSWA